MVQLKPARTSASGGIGAHDIYEALKEQIYSGVFGRSGQLPSSRGLADELGVSRTTVTIAFEQLHAEGFIELKQGMRPRVVKTAVHPPGRNTIEPRRSVARLSSYGERLRGFSSWAVEPPTKLIADFRHGDLSGTDFPLAAWRKALTEVMARRPRRMTYSDPRGSVRLRAALQGYLWRARTIRSGLEQIVIVNGSQQALDLCARILLDSGDRFAIENPCYDMARKIFTGTGATPVSVPVDQGGLDTTLLSEVDARLAYVTPSHQFPLGGVMPISRRHQLLDWAREHDAYVVEDDYDSEFRYDINPVPPLYGLKDCGRVIYSGTVSKTLAPSLRIGYLVVPDELQDVFASAKDLLDRHSPIPQQEALASLIESGAYERHIRRIRRVHQERRATLLNALRRMLGDKARIEGADAGLHVVVWLDGIPLRKQNYLLGAAGGAGLGLYPISPLYDAQACDPAPDRVGLVMGYSALEVREIERGVHILAEVLDATSRVA